MHDFGSLFRLCVNLVELYLNLYIALLCVMFFKYGWGGEFVFKDLFYLCLQFWYVYWGV